jgi:hypothetical protein
VQPFAIGNHLAFELSKVTLETGETSTARAKYCFIALDQELLFAHLRTRLLMFKNSSFDLWVHRPESNRGLQSHDLASSPLDDNEHAVFFF